MLSLHRNQQKITRNIEVQYPKKGTAEHFHEQQTLCTKTEYIEVF